MAVDLLIAAYFFTNRRSDNSDNSNWNVKVIAQE
jgi:hypothetical protein